MGDRYQWDTKCQKCGATIEVYYAPSCEMTTVKCWGCGTVFDIEQSFHLVESSGDKASAQEEGKVTPSGSEIISDADARRLLSDAGYFRTEDNIPAPSPAPINAEISGVDFTQPGAKLVIHPDPRFGFPAPLPKEVEEAMDTLHEAAYDGLCYKYHAKDNVEWWDAVLKAEVVIKTALQRYRELGVVVED